jgi:hypothetical protein
MWDHCNSVLHNMKLEASSGTRFLESKWLFFKSKWPCIKKIIF